MNPFWFLFELYRSEGRSKDIGERILSADPNCGEKREKHNEFFSVFSTGLLAKGEERKAK